MSLRAPTTTQTDLRWDRSVVDLSWSDSVVTDPSLRIWPTYPTSYVAWPLLICNVVGVRAGDGQS